MIRRESPQDEQQGVPQIPFMPRPAEAQPPTRFQQEEQGTQQSVDGEIEQDMEGLYIISVAARLLNMHPQTLRKYERLGLVSPSRTLGMLRLYSRADIMRIRLIRHLQDALGLNLAGVYVALDLLDRLNTLRGRLCVEKELDCLRSTVEEELVEVFGLFGLLPSESDL